MALRTQKIVSTFLSLTPIVKPEAKGLAYDMKATLKEHDLKLENFIGIGTDNASAMTGANYGLHKILKTGYVLPNLVLVRCVCHSLQLAISHASENTIPRNIEYMIREEYNIQLGLSIIKTSR
ncbi:unnamed protein product [Pieris macdunnoughi]|uniref:DUF4371 domain-containing protein n=1 Tax=Pieris macdunnoughi TaxID=345717 RepID=A0A821W5R8_9NEOP|nr:unnamed protein product [Pieris macdunnoughi]